MEGSCTVQMFNEPKDSCGPEKVFEFNDPLLDYEAILVIDSLKDGKSSGGIRISETIDRNEISAMAHSMTMKYCVLQRMMGGAKCGIRIPPDCTSEHKTRILESFGKKASGLLQKSTYIPYRDMNCTEKDIHSVLTAAQCPSYKVSDSSYFTALSVVSSITAACSFQKRSLHHLSCIIEGFGNVGFHIANELEKYGVCIMGISTKNGAIYNPEGFRIQQLIHQRESYGDELVTLYPDFLVEPKELLLERQCDILVPCAHYHSIHRDNMENINTFLIAPGANNPYDVGVEAYLSERNIICLPDFVTNIGGILGTSLFDNQVSVKRIHRFFDYDFSQFIYQLLQSSKHNRRTPGDIAGMLAEINHDQQRQIGNKSMDQSSLKDSSSLSSFISRLPSILQQQFYLFNERRIVLRNLRVLKRMGNRSSL